MALSMGNCCTIRDGVAAPLQLVWYRLITVDLKQLQIKDDDVPPRRGTCALSYVCRTKLRRIAWRCRYQEEISCQLCEGLKGLDSHWTTLTCPFPKGQYRFPTSSVPTLLTVFALTRTLLSVTKTPPTWKWGKWGGVSNPKVSREPRTQRGNGGHVSTKATRQDDIVEVPRSFPRDR
ncbi:hypothetical protein PR048_023077 [Dryococelus australis]|uniref:Uncharacterized protein n=1 Tax=Dryococelus australis TaxID=614101 RepID=A0ABQ9GT40_9NEOP|nr:hypothetical protein PR048_023077 [Dryococelus australis]